MEINDRILQVHDHFKDNYGHFNKAVFSRILGITTFHMSRLLRNQEASAKIIKAICNELYINESWLITGEGEMFQPTYDKGIIQETIKNHVKIPSKNPSHSSTLDIGVKDRVCTVYNHFKGKYVSHAMFANKIGVSPSYISHITNPKSYKKPSYRFIKTLCEKFGINEEWLRTGTGAMFQIIKTNNSDKEFFLKVQTLNDFERKLILEYIDLPKNIKPQIIALVKKVLQDSNF